MYIQPADKRRRVERVKPDNKLINAYCDDVLGTKDGVELAALIAAGAIQSSEAIEAAIARAQRVNPTLNAIATETFEQARNQHNELGTGLLAGVPSFIKDTDHVKGAPTLMGTRAVPEKPADFSSNFVEQFLSVGLVSLGKSTLPEFGLTATTESLATGSTHNPWNINYSTGGSSGGSAALVAAGVVPLAHGNDGGGSIRIPAACCGLVGLKPSRSRLADTDRSKKMPINIVCHGVISRSVRDTAAFYASVEEHNRNSDLPGIGLVQHPGKERLRIGLFTDTPYTTPSHADSVAVAVNAGKLCENLGHNVETISCPFKAQVIDDFLIYWGMVAFFIHHFGKKLFETESNKFEDIRHEFYWGRQSLPTLTDNKFLCNGAATRHEYISADYAKQLQISSGIVLESQSYIPQGEWDVWRLRGAVPVAQGVNLLIDINAINHQAPINVIANQHIVKEFDWDEIIGQLNLLHDDINGVYGDIIKGG